MKRQVIAALSALGCLAASQTAFAAFQLEVTEIWPGNDAVPNVSEDWFEVTNTGDTAWVAAVHGDLYYDDDSADPSTADLMGGIASIAPGESVIFLNGDAAAVADFQAFWGPLVGALPAIGTFDGAGLGTGAAGDAVSLWLGLPGPTDLPFIVASYPDPSGAPGDSYDLTLAAFSEVGNASGAVAGLVLPPPPDSTLASPGSVPSLPAPSPGVDLVITEIWPGNAINPDSTEDWFEVTNLGGTAWVAATHGDLYFDDDSMDPLSAVLLSGIASIAPGETVIFVDDGAVGEAGFIAFWNAPLGGLLPQIGTYAGAGLGAGGDTVMLWQSATPLVGGELPLTSASFPDTVGNPGASFDLLLEVFSVDGNAAGAIEVGRQAEGGEETVGSPGSVFQAPPAPIPFLWLLAPFLTALGAAGLRRRR